MSITPEVARRILLKDLARGRTPAELWPAARALLGDDEAAALINFRPTPAAPPAPSPGPGLLRRVRIFAAAVARHVRHGLPTLAPEEQERRLTACRDCPAYRPETGACGDCGCNLRLKTSWAMEHCPRGHW
jgi:hypothetical protein